MQLKANTRFHTHIDREVLCAIHVLGFFIFSRDHKKWKLLFTRFIFHIFLIGSFIVNLPEISVFFCVVFRSELATFKLRPVHHFFVMCE